MKEILEQIRDEAQELAEDSSLYENESFFRLANLARKGLGEPELPRLVYDWEKKELLKSPEQIAEETLIAMERLKRVSSNK